MTCSENSLETLSPCRGSATLKAAHTLSHPRCFLFPNQWMGAPSSGQPPPHRGSGPLALSCVTAALGPQGGLSCSLRALRLPLPDHPFRFSPQHPRVPRPPHREWAVRPLCHCDTSRTVQASSCYPAPAPASSGPAGRGTGP